ncbi:hypothetical protein EJ02DRAFT_514681 [Clathrospora elynae]|uniref:Uncharacterized protein n=1 Tax=Clathrospora elynae TaxID=706981 RepID=A0A6A5SI85_9PLEO|nr:hypothetical protein EJ02DRAFT_514681 [Clathrospora elynae]
MCCVSQVTASITARLFTCKCRPFSKDHVPAALRSCGHIFGYRCLLVILRGGDVDLSTTWSEVASIGYSGAECPECQLPIAHVDSEQRALSILREISSDTPDHRNKLNAFTEQLRESVASIDSDVEMQNIMQFFRRCYTSDGHDILQRALHDAASAGDYFSPFHDAISTSRGGDPQPMAFPLIRFCFMLWDVHHAIMRNTSLSINTLLWEGNRFPVVRKPLIQREDVEAASDLEDNKLFPLLHCFTMLVSQALARSNFSSPWLGKQRLELAQKLACESTGPHFEGKLTDKWLHKLAVIVNELKRHQFEMMRKPLTGNAAEKSIVRGWWGIANVEAEDVERGSASTVFFDAKRLPNDNENVIFINDCPHEWFFQHVSAVIHLGGAGTAACGLRNACPVVIVPFFGDQPFWGDMVAAAGADPQPIPHKLLTTKPLTEAIRFFLVPESKTAAQVSPHRWQPNAASKQQCSPSTPTYH